MRRTLMGKVDQALAAPKAKRSFSFPKTKQDAIAKELAAIRAEKAWAKLKPSHLVALWAAKFEEVYGVPPGLPGREYAIAVAFASRFAKEQFEGDLRQTCAFIAWAWEREAEREDWRRKNGRAGRVLGWQLQFSAPLYADWKIQETRRSRAGFSRT